jgi:hypothetical protein
MTRAVVSHEVTDRASTSITYRDGAVWELLNPRLACKPSDRVVWFAVRQRQEKDLGIDLSEQGRGANRLPSLDRHWRLDHSTDQAAGKLGGHRTSVGHPSGAPRRGPDREDRSKRMAIRPAHEIAQSRRIGNAVDAKEACSLGITQSPQLAHHRSPGRGTLYPRPLRSPATSDHDRARAGVMTGKRAVQDHRGGSVVEVDVVDEQDLA